MISTNTVQDGQKIPKKIFGEHKVIQSLTIAIVFELIYYTNGHSWGMTDIYEYIQNAMSTYYINQFFMAYIS